jgi:acetyl-CoA carboxylase carboxyl transferase subunit alpha
MHAESLLDLQIIDTILPEPQGGAHRDKEAVFHRVKEYILAQIDRLKAIPLPQLLEQRYQKFRKMGKFALHSSDSLCEELPCQEEELFSNRRSLLASNKGG